MYLGEHVRPFMRRPHLCARVLSNEKRSHLPLYLSSWELLRALLLRENERKNFGAGPLGVSSYVSSLLSYKLDWKDEEGQCCQTF